MPESSTGVIPFADSQASGLDPLSGAMTLSCNFLVDAAGALSVRPGIQAFTDFPASSATGSPVTAIFTWPLTGYLYFVCEDRTIWSIQAPGLVIQLSTADPLTQLDGTGRPIFSYDQERIVIAGGGAIQQIDALGVSSRLNAAAQAPSGSPLTATHIAYSAQRLVVNVNDRSGTLQWTPPGPGNHTTWPLVGPYWAEAEASPDPLVAVFANANEVFAFGEQTTQVYSPDEAIAFTVASSLQVGCSARYSIIETEDGTLAWLDDNRRFVVSNGRDVDAISSPGMAADINTLATISDCWGCNIMIGSHDLLLWVFPTEKRGPYYDRVTKKWGEFRSIDANADWTGFVANCYYYWPERNLHLVGMSDGTIATMSPEAFTDNGTTIRAVSQTGFIDRGTFNRKACQRVDLQLRRGGTVPPSTAPVVELRYRDDLGAWRPAKRFSMGAAQYQPVVTAWSQGMYRSRQWLLEWSGGSQFVLSGASETFQAGDT